MTTDDAQVTWVAPKGAFAFAEGQRAVEVTIDPLAPSAVAEPEPPLEIAGNVYLLEAAYRPSGDPGPARRGLDDRPRVPAAVERPRRATPSSPRRTGARWTALETSDLPSIQQADAELGLVGYVAVARTGSPSPSPPASGGGSSVGTILVSSAIAVLTFVAVYLIFGARRPSKRPGGRA